VRACLLWLLLLPAGCVFDRAGLGHGSSGSEAGLDLESVEALIGESRLADLDGPARPDGAGPPDDARHEGGAVDGPPTPTGLVGRWSMDEGQGTTTADSSGNKNTATLVDTPAWVQHVPGFALRFTDQQPNPHLEVNPSKSLNAISTGVSVAAWVNTDGSGWTQTILARRRGTGAEQQYALYVFMLKIGFRGRGGQIEHTLAPFPIKTWFHVAATYDGTTAALYIDGVQVATKPLSLTIGKDSNPLLIGAMQENQNTWSSMNGMLDEVRLYDRALSAAEVKLLAQ